MRFRQKMLLVMVWLLTLSYGVGGAFLIRQNFNSSLKQNMKNAESSYQMILQSIQLVNLVDIQQDFSNISQTLEKMNVSESIIGMKLMRHDTVLYQSGTTVTDFENKNEFESLLFMRDGNHYFEIKGEVLAESRALELIILYDVSPIYEARDEQVKTYHQIFLLLVLVGGVVSWLMSYLLTQPLSKVSRTARALASGDLDARVNPSVNDEIGQLGSDFDNMADRLADNINELKETMESQDQFMGSFAHELKTPMTSIIGYADLLRSQALTGPEAQEAANYIFSEGKRLESLSLKLLDLLMMKKENIALVPTDMKPMIERLVKHLSPVYLKNGIQIQCRCEPGICLAEPDLLSSVLTNLIDNARKALDHGGNIMILGERVDGKYRIRVIDNGRGMPEDALKHITEAFYRVDKSRSRAQGGAGLGLTLCKEVISLHKGTIAFASKEGSGTCVTVVFEEVSE